jgi:hypothetical protein
MTLRTASLGFASAFILIAVAPAFAGESGTILDSQQTNVITGNNNSVVNRSSQQSTTIQRGRGRSDSGTSVINTQSNDVLGNYNNARNINKQESDTRQNSRRGHQ